jgi:HD-like signal output (HDOD) protein
LHNIGEARVYRIIDAIPKAQDDLELVKMLVHRYHCAAGAEIAMAWKLPTEIVDACAAHHDPSAMQTPHVRLAMIADCVVDTLLAQGEPDWSCFEKLGVELSVAQKIVERTKKSAELSTVRPSRG